MMKVQAMRQLSRLLINLLLTSNVVYYIQTGNRITIMAVMHERQSPKTISDSIHQFIEHHS